MAVTRWWRRFHSNQRTGYPRLELLNPIPLNLQGSPPLNPYPLPTLLLIQPLSWLDKPIPFLATLEQHLLFPQENDIVVTLHQLNKAREELAEKVLLEWALDVLHSLEDWRWLWNPELATTPSSSLTLLNHQPSPPLCNASSANPWTMYTPNASNTFAPLLKSCPMYSCPICRELGHVGTSCPTTTMAHSPSLPP